jgi:hypothetical protein
VKLIKIVKGKGIQEGDIKATQDEYDQNTRY